MKNNTKKVTFLGLMTSFALVLSYIEVLLPPISGAVPGIKIGLANIVVIFLLYRVSVKEAAIVSLVRIVLMALLFGNFVTLLYSFAGAFLSLLTMFLLKKLKLFSFVGVSIAGGVLHNLGQIIMAMFLLETAEIAYYAVVLVVTGVVSGTFVGIAGSLILKYTNKKAAFLIFFKEKKS